MNTINCSSKELVELLRKNDAKAWCITYKKLVRQLYTIALEQISSKEVIQDLLHDAIILTYECLIEGTLESEEHLFNMARRAMDRQIMNFFKTSRNRRKREETFWDKISLIDYQPEPQNVELRKAFLMLDKDIRHVARLKYQVKMNNKDISTVMELSESTIKRLHRQFREFARTVSVAC